MKKFKLEHDALMYVEHPKHDGSNHIWVTGEMEVCPECGGEGSHVRRDLDDSAMVDSMMEDGDEEGLNSYYRGAFDEKCTLCKGKNVVLAPTHDSIPKWALDAINEWDNSERESREMEAAERRMGA